MDSPDDEEHHSSAGPSNATRPDVVALHPRRVNQDGVDASQSAKYRRIDRVGSRTSTTPDTSSSESSSSRFLFVDSSTSQRPRSDQRAINAHIQQTAHRNRRQAAAQRLRGTANIGRYRRDVQLQPRPPDPQNVQQSPLAPQNISITRASGISVDQQSLPTTPYARDPLDEESGDLAQQLIRLRHYGAIREPEVLQAFEEQENEDAQEALEAVQRVQSRASAESSSVKTLLEQILRRLDADNLGHAIHGRTANVLSNTVLDPFGTSSVQITPGMDAVLRHCKSNLPF